MYRMGHKPKKTRRIPVWIWPSASLLFVALLLIVLNYLFLKPKTTITQSAAVTTKVTAGDAATKVFDEPSFTLKLPSDWKLVDHFVQPYNLYRFQGTTKTNAGRIMEVYQDVIPVNFAVNRVIQLEPSGNQISSVGSVSDNCADFTKGTKAPGAYGVLAKWQGTDFLCDVDNTQRNVVGTSSQGGLNKVVIKGDSGGTHAFFFTYADHSINANYGSFYAALSSFTVK